MPVRIIGVDPGYDRMGIAVIEKQGAKETLLYSTCVITDRKESFGKRLEALAKEFSRIVKMYEPQELVLEKVFFTKNQTTAINVAEVRGVILYLGAQAGLATHEYSPPEIKVAITGYGKATKIDIAYMIPKIIAMNTEIKALDDELDAIAIALTHSAHRKTKAWN